MPKAKRDLASWPQIKLELDNASIDDALAAFTCLDMNNAKMWVTHLNC